MSASVVSPSRAAEGSGNRKSRPSPLDTAIKAWDMSPVEFQDLTWIEKRRLSLEQLQRGYQLPSRGSALIAVRFPASLGTSKGCSGYTFQSQTCRLTVDSILATNSPILEERLFNQRIQAKARARWSRTHSLPQNVDYILDLTPSEDPDEVSLALSNLSLTEGIIQWSASSASMLNTPGEAVLGHDDSCLCGLGPDTVPVEKDASKSSKKKGGPVSTKKSTLSGLWDTAVPPFCDITDFNRVRQAATVLRLLRVMDGQMLYIDSAARLWTLVGLFRYFRMSAYDLLRPKLRNWIFRNKNSLFLECLPEEALVMGVTLQCPWVSEPAFSILVNERALAMAGGWNNRTQPPTTTIFKRKASDCMRGNAFGDDLTQRIDHAAENMVDRVGAIVDELHSSAVFERLQVGEWSKLVVLTKLLHNHEAFCDRLQKALIWRFLVEFDTSVNQLPTEGESQTIDDARYCYTPKEDFIPFKVLYESFTPSQRALCSPMWRRLRDWWPLPTSFVSSESCDYAETINEMVERFNELFMRAFPRGSPRYHAARYSVASCVRTTPELRDVLMFDHLRFWEQVSERLALMADSLLAENQKNEASGYAYSITPHLLNRLSLREMHCLHSQQPGGHDEELPPPTILGPNGPGPAFHTGITVASTIAGTDKSGTDVDDEAGTIVASESPSSKQDGTDTTSGFVRLDHRSQGAIQSSAAQPGSVPTVNDEQPPTSPQPQRQPEPGPTDHDGPPFVSNSSVPSRPISGPFGGYVAVVSRENYRASEKEGNQDPENSGPSPSTLPRLDEKLLYEDEDAENDRRIYESFFMEGGENDDDDNEDNDVETEKAEDDSASEMGAADRVSDQGGTRAASASPSPSSSSLSSFVEITKTNTSSDCDLDDDAWSAVGSDIAG